MKSIIVIVYVINITVFTFSPVQAVVQYTLTDLGTLGGTYSQAWGINNAGQVVGQANIPNEAEHAFLYSGSTMTDLVVLQIIIDRF